MDCLFEKRKINEFVVELEGRCRSLYRIKPILSEADMDASMQSIVAGVCRLECNISLIVDRQRDTLLNVAPFDIRNALQTLGYIRWDVTLLGGLEDAIKSIDNIMRVEE